MKLISKFNFRNSMTVSRNLFGLLIIAAFVSSCSTTGQVSKTPDDLYYSSADRQSNQDHVNQYDTKPVQQEQQQEYVQDNNNQNYDNPDTRQETDGNGNTYITNNYNGGINYVYDDDDYYYTR